MEFLMKLLSYSTHALPYSLQIGNANNIEFALIRSLDILLQKIVTIFYKQATCSLYIIYVRTICFWQLKVLDKNFTQ